MNMKLYNATQAHLRSRALELLAQTEAHLSLTAGIEQGTVEKIADAACQLAQIEGALITLQQYFQPAPPPMSATPGAHRRDEEPLTVTPEMSPTYKKSLEKQKAKEGSTKRRKKKDE